MNADMISRNRGSRARDNSLSTALVTSAWVSIIIVHSASAHCHGGGVYGIAEGCATRDRGLTSGRVRATRGAFFPAWRRRRALPCRDRAGHPSPRGNASLGTRETGVAPPAPP